MIRFLLILVLAALGAVLPSGPARAAEDDHCRIEGVRFASCDPDARLFEAVIVAVPGWNGTCAKSFGEADSNLLNVMRQTNFFDIDCFDYDSHGTPIDTSVKRLRARLEALADAGYREVSFVTHSTGGVLVLHLLLSEIAGTPMRAIRLGPDRSLLFRNRDGMRLVALYAWAIPINGVRDHICQAGRIGNLFGASRAVLPLLCADSAYLAWLKQSYGALNDLYGQLSPRERSGFRFMLYILQGQGTDWVVNGIEPGSPWFPSNADIRLVSTLSGHTVVVEQNGTVHFPSFSGETMADKSQLHFSLLPRTHAYFRETLTPTETLDRNQRAILGGVVDFASVRNLFAAGASRVSEFVVMLFNGRFRRDPGFDDYAVGRLDALLRFKADTLDGADAVRFGDDLLADIERGYVTPNATDPLLFGGQSKTAVRSLVDTVAYILETVRVLVGEDSGLASELRNSNHSLPEFEIRAARVLDRFLEDTDIAARDAGIAVYAEFARTASLEAVSRIDIASVFGRFARENYFVLDAGQKAALGEVFTTLAGRSPEIGVEVQSVLNQPVPWFGREVPLWTPLLNEDQTRFMLEESRLFEAPEIRRDFLSGVITNAGRFGHSRNLADFAIEDYGPFLSQGVPDQIEFNAEILLRSAEESAFPVVRMQGLDLLREYGFERLAGP